MRQKILILILFVTILILQSCQINDPADADFETIDNALIYHSMLSSTPWQLDEIIVTYEHSGRDQYIFDDCISCFNPEVLIGEITFMASTVTVSNSNGEFFLNNWNNSGWSIKDEIDGSWLNISGDPYLIASCDYNYLTLYKRSFPRHGGPVITKIICFSAIW